MSLLVDVEKDLGRFHLSSQLESDSGTLGILGASGCGKSLTLKCIAGIERPDRGHIELDGVVLFDSKRRIDLPPQKRRVGYLFQNYALFPNMTVRQNILCGLKHERDRAQRESLLTTSIRRFDLTGLEKQRPDRLSGGQQQRVALARILVSRPKLLMLDEPFSALDTHLRERLQVELRELLEGYDGLSLLVTHSRDEAYRLCGRIALMEGGRILETQPTKQLFAAPRSVNAAAMTGCKNIARAVKRGEHELYVPDWDVTLTCAETLTEGLCAVGIRAHYFGEHTRHNLLPVTFGEAVEEPFELILPFRYAGQQEDSAPLWWRLPKERRPAVLPSALGVAPVNVLPLYEES